MPGSLLCSAAGSFICHNAAEDCVSWSEGEWKINPNCSLKSWLIIKGRSLRMILIHKRLMMSLKRSHAIWKILGKFVLSFIYINSSLSEYDPLEISNEGLSSHSTPLWKISVHQLFSRWIPKGRVNNYGVSQFFFCLPSSWWKARWRFFVCQKNSKSFCFLISAEFLQMFALLEGCKRHQFSLFHILLLVQFVVFIFFVFDLEYCATLLLWNWLKKHWLK